MLLRRVINHFRKQEWTAIAIDFVIVVLGVGFAMLGQQWLADRQLKSQMIQAEAALQSDLAANYFFAKERVALAACRMEALQAVAGRLLEPGEEWIGMPREDEGNIAVYALPVLLRSPSRPWAYRNWIAGLSRGTFDHMDQERRELLDVTFAYAASIEELENEIHALQGRLKVLAVSTRLGPSDRLRYYDALGEIDVKSAILEIKAGQIAAVIEEVGIVLTDEERRDYLETLSEQSQSSRDIYGDCFKPATYPAMKVGAS